MNAQTCRPPEMESRKITGKWARDVLLVARNELSDSIRSRRTLMLVFLYAALIVFAGWMMIRFIESISIRMLTELGISSYEDADALAPVLWKSAEYQRLTRGFLGAELQESAAGMHPFGWIFGVMAFTLTPILVMWTSAARIAEDVGSRAVRFVAVRISRLSWCLGKYAGQAIQLLLAMLAGGTCMWILGLLYMPGFAPAASAGAIFRMTIASWIWGLGFLGLATGVSQLTARHHMATAMGTIVLIAVYVVHVLSDNINRHAAWKLLDNFFPTGYYRGLWSWEPACLLPAVVMTCALSLLYLFAGYFFFSKRDL
jgi:predicted thioesterase